jgi:hypothetical protein
MNTRAPRKIMSREFAEALAAAGIIHDLGNVRRIVLDAQAGDVVRVYVEYYGDERWLNVTCALDGVEVTTSAPPPVAP